MKRSQRHRDEARATIQTMTAIAAIGGRFYDSLGLTFGETQTLTLWQHTTAWSTHHAVVETYTDACKVQAFSIERDDASGKMRGYRLFRLGGGDSGTGHRYHGETFPTPDVLWNAMRLVEDLACHPACKVEKPKAAKPQSIVVIGYEWRDKSAGNTYHRSSIVIDGEHRHTTPFTYGGGSIYEESAQEWLVSEGILPNGERALWRACENAGIKLYRFAVPVATKKEMG